MTESITTQVVLPALIALIMFGMGLSLTASDFTRLVRFPKPIAAGLFGQIMVLPLLAFAIGWTLGLSPVAATGLMILSACPGGTMSNIISQLARANLALSVTLTGFSTLICLFTTPLIIEVSLRYFLAENEVSFSLLKTTLGLILVTLLPILLGMLVRYFKDAWAIKFEPYFRRFSLVFMVVMIAVILWQERAMLSQSFSEMFLACLLLNLISVCMGLLPAKIFDFSTQDAITLSVEVGIQNATLAMLIAMSFLNRPDLAVAAGVYGITMYIGAGLIVLWSKLAGSNKQVGNIEQSQKYS